MATLRDVAQRAGVDPSTVSRVVNGDRNLVIRADTRQRIIDAVSQLGYRANGPARGLRLRTTLTLGFVAEDVALGDGGAVLAGALDAATEAGYCLLVARGASAGARIAREGRVDGLVTLVGPLEASCPQVAVGERTSGCYVAVDDAEGARLAVLRLLERGHRRIGCLVDDLKAAAEFARFDGYRAALAERGLPFSMAFLGADARTLVAAGASALFSASGPSAAGLRAVRDAVEVVVWGEDVSVPLEAMGREAVRLTLELIAGRASFPAARLLPPEIRLGPRRVREQPLVERAG